MTVFILDLAEVVVHQVLLLLWNFYANCIEVMPILVLEGKSVFDVRGMLLK